MSIHIAFDRVGKAFGSVRVLEDISFALEPSRVYGLLGENGAGKSTLMKILAGYLPPTDGTLSIDGKPVRWDGPKAAEAAGIVLIHQELSLAESLTIAQNIFLGHELGGWFVDDRRMNRLAADALADVGFEVDPRRKIKTLIAGQKQLVEIAKARVRNTRLLILDEPTASLTPSEVSNLFALIERLRQEGVTIIYISHKLEEVERITDEIIVMRDGRLVGRAPTRDTNRAAMTAMMVGRDIASLYPAKVLPDRSGPPAFEVEKLTVPGWADAVSFSIWPGEILGFAGLVGAGRTELFEGLIGLRPSEGGTVRIGGRPVRFGTPREAARAGLTYLSEDRKGKGLHTGLSLRTNVTLTDLPKHAHPFLSDRSEDQTLKAAIARFGIRASNGSAPASSLSGGNQQKLAIAKFFEPDPDIIILDEPTKGVDVGAKAEIYRIVADLAASGKSIIAISSELIELIGLCHRVMVMRAHEVTAEVSGDNLNEEEILSHAIGK